MWIFKVLENIAYDESKCYLQLLVIEWLCYFLTADV